MKNVAKQMKMAIPTTFNYELLPSMNRDFSDFESHQKYQNFGGESELISAFQRALKGMAFQVDGEKIGEMVVDKVETVVFA